MAFFLSSAVLHANTESDLSHAVLTRTPDNIMGPLEAYNAFQALRLRDMSALVEALNTKPSPVNEALNISTPSGVVRVRLAHVAALTKDERFVRVLQNFGARFEATDSLGRNAIHYLSFGFPEVSALFDFKPIEDGYAAALMLNVLFAAGVDANLPDDNGRRAIHYAALAGDPRVMRQLLSYRVEVDPYDNDGFAPVHHCLNNLHFFCPELLKQHGSLIEITAFDYAFGFGNRVKTFAKDHTFALASVAVTSACALGVSLIGLVKESLKPSSTNPFDDPESEEPPFGPDWYQASPAPAIFGQGGKGALTVAPVASHQKTKRNQERAAARKAKAVAAAPVAMTEVVETEPVQNQEVAPTITKVLQGLTKDLNSARKSGNQTDMRTEIELAATYLETLEGQQLSPDEKKERSWLVSAIHSMTTLVRNPSPAFRIRVLKVYEDFKKYHVRR